MSVTSANPSAGPQHKRMTIIILLSLLNLVSSQAGEIGPPEAEWVYPALPEKNVTTATSGQTITLRWTSALQDLFGQPEFYLSGDDPTNVDLWIVDYAFQKYSYLTSSECSSLQVHSDCQY